MSDDTGRPDYDTYDGMKKQFEKLHEFETTRVKLVRTTNSQCEDLVWDRIDRLIFSFAYSVCEDPSNLLFRDYGAKGDVAARKKFYARGDIYFQLLEKFVPKDDLLRNVCFMIQFVIVLSDIVGYDIDAHKFITRLYRQVSHEWE